ncbi:MAG: hypothetical protein WCI72_05085 [archaeon]
MAKTLKQIIEDIHPLARPTLRNVARMSLYPTGIMDFGDAVAEDLKLKNSQVGNLLKYSGALCDVAKYLFYGFAIGSLIYKN